MLETIGYVCLGIVAAVYVVLMLTGIVAMGAFSWIGLLLAIGIGALFVKVLAERIANKEDDHYSKNVER
ncbi:MAG: hypothetical protein AAGH76_12035 [Pseudomonadota bacterium]